MDRTRIAAIAVEQGVAGALPESFYRAFEAVINEVRGEAVVPRAAALSAVAQALRTGMAADTVERREQLALAVPTVTSVQGGAVVAITLQDEEHRILEPLWMR